MRFPEALGGQVTTDGFSQFNKFRWNARDWYNYTKAQSSELDE